MNDIFGKIDELKIEIGKLMTENCHNIEKWRNYEQNYILPLYEIANIEGFDLAELVKTNPGRNCVILFVEEIMKRGNVEWKYYLK